MGAGRPREVGLLCQRGFALCMLVLALATPLWWRMEAVLLCVLLPATAAQLSLQKLDFGRRLRSARLAKALADCSPRGLHGPRVEQSSVRVLRAITASSLLLGWTTCTSRGKDEF